jgi:hypothetical protein
VIWFLRIFFGVVLASMLAVTTWASLQLSVFAIPRAIGAQPWFIATLFDAYWAFFTFYLWLAYKEAAWISCILWLVAVVLLGNIATSIYCLIQLFRVSSTAAVKSVLIRHPDSRPVPWWVPATLLMAGGGIAHFA